MTDQCSPDIVARLREPRLTAYHGLRNEAADEIERLHQELNFAMVRLMDKDSEIERLRAVAQSVTVERALGVLKFVFDREEDLSQESIDEIALILDDAGIMSAMTSTQPPQDHEPRCDCGHLFEICNAPNCPSAMTSTLRGDGQS